MNQPPDNPDTPAPIPQLDARDSMILTYIAGQQLVTRDHIGALLASREGTDIQVSRAPAEMRTKHLVALGLLARQPIFHQRPAIYQITRPGLQAIGSNLPLPAHESLRSLQHDLAAGWLWLAVLRGAFGPHEYILTRRQLVDQDLATRRQDKQAAPSKSLGEGQASPFSVRTTTAGSARRHYPDLIFTTNGRTVAVELLLYTIGRDRLRSTILAYGQDHSTTAAILLPQPAETAQLLRDLVAECGYHDRVQVDPFELTPTLATAAGW